MDEFDPLRADILFPSFIPGCSFIEQIDYHTGTHNYIPLVCPQFYRSIYLSSNIFNTYSIQSQYLYQDNNVMMSMYIAFMIYFTKDQFCRTTFFFLSKEFSFFVFFFFFFFLLLQEFSKCLVFMGTLLVS